MSDDFELHREIVDFLSMNTDVIVDLSLLSAECELTTIHTGVEHLSNVDSTDLDCAIDFSTTSASDQLFDFGATGLETQWPLLSPPPSVSKFTDFPGRATPPKKHSEAISGGRQKSNEPGACQSGMQKVNRVRKTKGSQRPHYAVEKRYRSTLNEKYATLSATLSSDVIQRICKTDSTESRDMAPQMPDESPVTGPKSEHGAGQRQQKTTTLSMTINTINLLRRCCNREAKELEQLRNCVQDIKNRAHQALHAKIQPNHEQHGREQQ